MSFIREPERPLFQGQYYQGNSEPYRPLGFCPQESTRLDLEINLEIVITRENVDLEQKLGLKINDINAHLSDLDSWKKGVDTQLAHLTTNHTRAHGTLPGHP